MAYDADFHKSARALGDEGAPFVYTPENRARFDEIVHALSGRSAPLGGAAGALSGAGAAGLHHRERDAPRRRAARHARRADVEDVVSYYTMFYTRPVGKFVLQVCRTLSCALNGAERVTEELREKLGIKPGETDAERHVHADRGRVPRRLRPRAGRDGQRRWHEMRSTPEDAAELVDDICSAARRKRRSRGCHLKRREDEPRLSGQRRGFVMSVWNRFSPNTSASRTPSRSTSTCSTAATTALKKALGEKPDDDHRAGEGVGPARPRRRRVSDRHEVAVRRQEGRAALHRLQRRRERAGHVQGSPADGAQPAPAHRGLRDRLLRDRREGRLHLHPRRVLPRPARCSSGDRRGLRAGLPRQEHPRLAASTATSTSTAAPAPTRPAKRRRCSSRSKASARSRATSRRFRRWSASTASRPRSTTSRRCAMCRSIVAQRRRVVRGARAGEERRPEAVLRQRPREAARRLRSVDEVDAARADLRLRRRRARRPHAQGGDPRRFVGADPAAGSARHAGQLRRDPESRVAARFGGDRRARRHHLHGLARREPAAFLPPRVVRQVHAVPRRHRLAAQDPAARSSAAKGEMRDLDLLVEHLGQHRRQDAVRVRRRRGHAGADDVEAFPARVRSAHQAKGAARCRPTGAREQPVGAH